MKSDPLVIFKIEASYQYDSEHLMDGIVKIKEITLLLLSLN